MSVYLLQKCKQYVTQKDTVDREREKNVMAICILLLLLFISGLKMGCSV